MRQQSERPEKKPARDLGNFREEGIALLSEKLTRSGDNSQPAGRSAVSNSRHIVRDLSTDR